MRICRDFALKVLNVLKKSSSSVYYIVNSVYFH